MKDRVTLRFRTSRYARESEKTFEVTRDDWPVQVVTWLWPALEEYEKATSLTPPHLTVWDSLRHALPALSKVRSWGQFTTIPTSDLEVDDVRDLFMDIDDTFHRLWGQERGALRSSTSRRFLLRHLMQIRPDGTLNRVVRTYATKGRSNYKPRKLISDQVLRDEGAAVQAPLGALPHSNVAELKELTRLRLEADLQKISNACVQELDSYDRACGVLERIIHSKVNVLAKQSALQKINETQNKKAYRGLTLEEQDALITYYAQYDHTHGTPHVGNLFRGSDSISKRLSELMGIVPDRIHRCIRYQYFPHQTVLVAAILLLQIHTAWNVSSIIRMSASSIKVIKENQYLIQSYKDKTGDDTPPVFLEGSDNPAIKALKMLLNRLQMLKQRGWANESEDNLWIGPRISEKSMSKPVSNISKGLATIRERYDLPYFTFEQIRPQKLTLISIEKGPIAAAEVAGHSTFSTIGGYIDHLLSQRYSSAVNLEFQKRWEKEVALRISGKPIKNAIIPIGDGASCNDPESPPNKAWLDAGICNAKRCHSGDGCSNRVLVINSSTIQEVILTRKFYLANWQRLYANNPEAFSDIHLDKIEFNFHLYQYIKNGPYRHMLND